MPRVLSRLLLALLTPVLGAGGVLAVATSAVAGGPTSVLLASPSDQAAAALYYTDPRYAELEELLHGTDQALERSFRDPGSVTALNLTWLIHDVTIWRVDRLMLDGSGDAWVSTTDLWDGEGLEETSGGSWTRLRDGDRVREIVASLGLLDVGIGKAATASPAAPLPAAQDDTEPAGAVPPAPVVREETRWFSLAGWRWAVPGLLGGALLMSVLARRRRGGGPTEPRQQLVDGPDLGPARANALG